MKPALKVKQKTHVSSGKPNWHQLGRRFNKTFLMIVGKVNWRESKSKKAMHLFETPALFDIEVNSQVESCEWQKTISFCSPF